MKKHAFAVKFEIEALRHLLATDERWAKRALVRIYNAQTQDEKSNSETYYENGVGFNGSDARLLTKIAKWYLDKDYIGAGYMKIVHDRIQKYASQIFGLPDFDHEKFDKKVADMVEKKEI